MEKVGITITHKKFSNIPNAKFLCSRIDFIVDLLYTLFLLPQSYKIEFHKTEFCKSSIVNRKGCSHSL